VSQAVQWEGEVPGDSRTSEVTPAGQRDDAAADSIRRRSGYTLALIDEIRLLTRTIANDPNRHLQDLKMTYQFHGDAAPQTLVFSQVVNRVAEIEGDPARLSRMEEVGFLQSVRDVLVATTAPASGETIAYTTMVAGDQRRADVESGYDLARSAYGRLGPLAARHRWAIRVLAVVAIAATLFAACEATRAALGKSLLQNLDLLRTQQIVIAEDKLKLETSLDPQIKDDKALLDLLADDKAPIPTFLVPLCDRHTVRAALLPSRIGDAVKAVDLRVEISPAVRDVCGRDSVLMHNIGLAHRNLTAYGASWPSMAGALFAPIQWAFGKAPPGEPPAPAEAPKPRDSGDIEFLVAPMLQVITNYELPLVFGFIGSILYVLLDHFTKMRMNTLSPKDFPLMGLRLILGLVIAACVSLLISSYAGPGAAALGPASGIPSPGALVATLTLSAAGIAFLAGFGAEAVFILLQNLVVRVFAVPKS
jgi:hypothetical protein